jgi:hypothetical protein
VERRIGHGAWGGYTWSVLVERAADEEFLAADLLASDGRRHTSGMGGPITWPGRPLSVYAGRADGFPLIILARTDRAQNLELRIDGVDAEPIWSQVGDGVHYLFHLIPETGSVSTVEVVGRTGSGEVREAARLL